MASVRASPSPTIDSAKVRDQAADGAMPEAGEGTA